VLSATGRAKPKVIGVSHDYPQLVRLPVREGRFFDRRDEDTFAQVCVIGDGVRRELFGFDPAVGRPLKINDQWLTVVGVLAPGGGPREIQGVTLAGPQRGLSAGDRCRAQVRPRPEGALDELIVRMGRHGVQLPTVVANSRPAACGAEDYTITVPGPSRAEPTRSGSSTS
jgi:putative ABC transport system permease protein